MANVLLVTCSELPDGEPGGELLTQALQERQIASRWVTWDDPDVDWGAADLVAVRATWDYHSRFAPFLAWARAVDDAGHLLNGADVFAWNADKAYLVAIADRLPVVPTALADETDLAAGVARGVEQYGAVVVKSRTGAGGIGVVIAESAEDPRLGDLSDGPWVVQPLVESVRTEGETSVFVIDGHVASQIHKVPAGGEFRVHEEYGGLSRPVPVTAEFADLATRAVAVGGEAAGARLDYARVDMMRLADGTLAISELEVIEPGLYLDVVPENAGIFADLVARVVHH